MRKILAVALVALAACSAKDKGIQYGAPAAPTSSEQVAIGGATTTIQSSVGAFVAPTQPEAGVVALADQLAAGLGANGIAGTGITAKTAATDALRRALGPIDTTGCFASVTDPVTGVVTVSWTACHVQDVYDDGAGTITTTTLDLDGSLTWNPATRTTTWSIVETMDMSATGAQPMAEHVTATLVGSTVVTDTTITADATSTFGIQMTYPGLPAIDAEMKTVLDADLGYQAVPFCITSGTLVLERTWPKRPIGATSASLPDQGWSFAWSGCDAYTVAHGS